MKGVNCLDEVMEEVLGEALGEGLSKGYEIGGGGFRMRGGGGLSDLRASPKAVHMPLSWCRKVSAFSVATRISTISLHTSSSLHTHLQMQMQHICRNQYRYHSP